MCPRRVLLGLSLVLCGFLVGCLPNLTTGKTTPHVVCTTTLVADLARSIGGDVIEVESLMGPQIDPHRYSPSAGDIDKLTSAKLVLYHGLHLEGKMTDVLEHNPKLRAVAVTKDLPTDELLRGNVDGGEYDPHVWFDPALWARCAGTVRAALVAAFPEHEATFQRNEKALLEQFVKLDAELKQQADSLPKERRVLVTSHDAFGYFGKTYGFEVFGLQGVSTSAEVGTNDITQLADVIGQRQVPALFTETSVPPKSLQRVLDEVKAKYHRSVKLVGDAEALYSDALGDRGTPGETYPGLMRTNMATIVKALR
jgi:manganese/zinc/iron transport system substrate-binding protein